MGINVLRFVENTLHKNAKDREFLLYIEDETRKFVEDDRFILNISLEGQK
jgi:hypothetical protein